MIKQRYLYSLIFGIPGIFISLFIMMFIGGSIAAFLFVITSITDSPLEFFWTFNGLYLPIIIFSATLFFITRTGFKYGKNREIKNIPVNKKHVLALIITLILLAIFITFYQMGYVSEKSEMQICEEMCIQEGYGRTGTGINPGFEEKRICSCFNNVTKKWDEFEIIKPS